MKQPTVVIDSHPHCGPWMMASTKSVTPTVETRTPGVSKRRCWGAAIFGMSSWPRTKVISTRGTLIRKIDPYQ